MGDLIFLLLAAAIVVVGFFVGRFREQAHLADLDRREAAARALPVSGLKSAVHPDPAAAAALVCGEAVIASDAFKSWIFAFRNVFGGEARNFTRLYDRARREATLRMVADARARGFDAICNVRHMSIDIAGNATQPAKRVKPMATCVAFGTAYKRL